MTSNLDVPAACPACSAPDVAVMLYGEPAADPATIARRFAPTPVFFAGCVIGAHAPRWRCVACNHMWGRARDEPAA